MSGETMNFPKDPMEFINDYSFVNRLHAYTNGAELIPVFRVKQMIEHYFTDNNTESESIE